MEDNYNTETGSQQQAENPYPKFEENAEQPAQYSQNNDLGQPLIMGDEPHQSNDKIDKFLLYVKYANIIAGLFVGVVGLYFVITFKIWNFDNFLMSFYSMFLPVYYVFFGLLLAGAEYYKLEVNIYFRFLRSYLGRGIFNIFLATQCNLAWDRVGSLFGWVLFSLGVVYIFLHFIRSKVQQDVKQKLLD